MGLNRYFGGKPAVTNKPIGWCVREKFNPNTKKIIAMEFGIYVDNEKFVSLPIHFSIKDSLIPLNVTEKLDEYEVIYYALPAATDFKLLSLTSKNGKKYPLLVPVTEPGESIGLLAYAFFADEGHKILNFETDAMSVRDYIDKDRKYVCGIFINKESKIITTDLTYSLSRHVHHKKSIWTEYNNTEEVSEEVLKYEPKTKFIKFNRLNLNHAKKEDAKCDCDGTCEECTCADNEQKS